MENYFDYQFEVAYHETDIFGKIKLSALMYHTQQSAGAQVEANGYSYRFLRERDFVYLIIRYQINMERYPEHGETITIRTWFGGVKGATLLRFHKIYGEDGKLIGEASGVWVVVSFSKRSIIRPASFPYLIDTDTVTESSIGEVPKCIRAENLSFVNTKRIRYTELDTNQHFTNTAYADLVCDCIDELIEGKEIASFRICFVKEALYNDIMSVFLEKEKNRYFISGDIAGKTCFDSEAVLR